MTKNKQILVITSTFPRWQGDKEPPFVYELSQRLAQHYTVHILAPHAEGAALTEQFNNLRVTRFRYFFTKYQTLAYGGGILPNLKQNRWRYLLVPFFIIAEWFALVRLLRQEKFDLIHAHWLVPQGLVALLAAAFFKKSPPILCTSHGGDLFGLQGKLFKKLKQFVLKRSTALTVVSHTMQETALSLGAEAAKIQVIPMGVDLINQFVPTPTTQRENALLFVGRLVEKKGLHYLLAALPLIIKQHSNVTLTIAGSGTDESKLKKQVIDLELNQYVKFLGAVENEQLPVLYQSSEIVIFPSIIATDGDREGFGLVLVEALGCECAVAASDLPAMQDILTDNENALIFKQKNSQDLAEKVNQLLSNRQLCLSLGKRGRQNMLERYDWEIITEKYRLLMTVQKYFSL
ncbi:MAG: glycosyltransferase family 4 protein [Candidatus Parabeggiatoa sp. nov. 1]|nr:MAG: glycosyltransferase family 4 protein [Gammaproteobacteria bacterium]